MRSLFTLTAVLTLSGCCCGRCGPEKKSYTDAPTTVAAARKLAADPKLVVAVETRTRAQGGGACGHSAACLVFAPFILFDTLFPTRFDEVTVTEGGALRFTGQYEVGGELLIGTSFENGVTNEISRLDLHELGQRSWLQTGRFEPDGGRQSVPLLPQHDFLADYRKLIASLRDAHRKGALYAEAETWLDAESEPLLLEALGPAEQSDEVKAAVIAVLCGNHAQAPRPYEAKLLAALPATTGPLTALAALPCFTERPAEATRFFQALVDTVCHAGRDFEAPLAGLTAAVGGDFSRQRAAVLAQVAACGMPRRRALLQLWLSEPAIDLAALTALLESEDGPVGLKRLDAERTIDRAALFAALKTPASSRAALIEKLAAGHPPLTADELLILTRVYLDPQLSVLSVDGVRVRLLRLLHDDPAVPDREARTRSSRDALHAARAKAKSTEQFDAALLVLGERDRLVPLTAVLEAPINSHSGPAVTALLLAGCTMKELEQSVVGRKHAPLKCDPP